MPPRKRIPARGQPTNTRKSTRRKEVIESSIPDVYQDMLAEAVASGSGYESERLSKRRKVKKEPTPEDDDAVDRELFGDTRISDQVEEEQKPPQTVYDDFEDSEDSEDIEFEDVEIGVNIEADDESDISRETLQLDLSKPVATTPSRNIQRRRIIGAAERKIRLDIHKTHLLLLLLAVANRNRWCESGTVQALLKPLVPRKTISLLHVDDSQPQFQRSHSLNKGIEELCAMWRAEWSITAKGMHRAHWRDDVNVMEESEDAEDFIEFDDFVDAATTRSGSRDLGAQLFCALLRSVALETRLVCSLQVLPFSGTVKGQTPEKAKPDYIYAPPQNFDKSSPRSAGKQTQTRKKLLESQYPIFWVEVLSPATSTWIPLDPLVRKTINKPKTGFEPPASDQLNNMIYVVAFEDDGTARDVTRRYSQWFNAKTRKVRVESTKGGGRWWKKTMDFFDKRGLEIQDEIEQAEFIRRAETEGMPKNVQDFKGHPVYVLEKHLRRNEVIHPRREVGKVAAGVSKNAKLENVFRRQDVHLCRTADAWYRRGRDVRQGEAPLKRAVPKKSQKGQAADVEDEDSNEESEGVALYAEYQTDVYEPPPVIDGRIPRNAFGNLDVYVPSMIPAGAIHVRHPLAAQAAKVLEIDFAEAVTGFEFKGRQGTAVINGVVVSQDMRIAMVTVIIGLQSQAAQESEAERSRVLLSMWKRWLTALRVRARVEEEYGGNEEEDKLTDQNTSRSDDGYEGEDETYHDEEDAGGGFMPEASEDQHKMDGPMTEPTFPSLKPIPALLPPEVIYQEIVVIESPHQLKSTTVHVSQMTTPEAEQNRGGFLFEDSPGPDMDPQTNSNDEQEGGGFMIDNDEDDVVADTANHQSNNADFGDGGGGFIVEDGVEEGATQILHDKEVTANTETGKAAGIGAEEVLDEAEEQLSDTSMLSHDPAEDDADPEWLIDSLGE